MADMMRPNCTRGENKNHSHAHNTATHDARLHGQKYREVKKLINLRDAMPSMASLSARLYCITQLANTIWI